MVIGAAAPHRERLAVADRQGRFTYGDLLARSERVAATLLDGAADLEEARVAFLVPPGWDHVAVQWGIWRAGGVAVPLCLSHPEPELAYTVDDAEAAVLVAGAEHEDVAKKLAAERCLRFLAAVELGSAAAPPPGGTRLPALAPGRRAMLVYTSGTTGRPKGVVFTHGTIGAQVAALHEAWGWSADDRILNVLPLHHVHGIVNVLCSALAAGAVWETLPRFDAGAAWSRLASGEITLLMAVPTVYVRLVRAWEGAPAARRKELSAAAVRLRLMVSGSAALPVDVLERWQELTGHVLLERYGMTEIGMALSNPLEGERRPGFVGQPLPGVEVRLVDEAGEPVPAGEPGELLVRGPGVFPEYWRRPEATAASFRDGWFATGDAAVLEVGSYRILGRKSVDILKTGGYKVSALEIEGVLRTHPGIEDCAVVGLEDPEWGEKVAAALVLAPGARLDGDALRAWGKERLAPYKVPTAWLAVEELPRNVLGKVLKPAVRELFA